MTKSVLTAFALVVTCLTVMGAPNASAQSEILAEMYGRGVHSYYAGDYDSAEQFLSMAIDNHIEDPRAYYFRGLVMHTTGKMDDAESDWKRGAEMEANGQINASIGRSLSRFQGAARLKLESIRQQARLKALATAAARAKARYGELEAAEARVLRQPPRPIVPPPVVQAAPADEPVENPFKDNAGDGQATVQSDDALKGAMENPFADKAAVPAGQVPPNDPVNPFDGAGEQPSPFGGDDEPMEKNPFESSEPSPFDQPSGDSPFGENPFGDNPFEN
ncbi:MAG: hypothetical protein MI861_19175 [Pirellulales bacterium]|nr:hypothetical protein [Pirellulales bacterium]